jgi:hypothetical protein
MKLIGETEVLWEKRIPVPLCSPQIPNGLTRDRTRAPAVRSRRLTAWGMARPGLKLLETWMVNITSAALCRKKKKPAHRKTFCTLYVCNKTQPINCSLSHD